MKSASEKSEERKFWKDAYLVALSGVLGVESNWQIQGKEARNCEDRSAVAGHFANAAVENLRKAREGVLK